MKENSHSMSMKMGGCYRKNRNVAVFYCSQNMKKAAFELMPLVKFTIIMKIY